MGPAPMIITVFMSILFGMA